MKLANLFQKIRIPSLMIWLFSFMLLTFGFITSAEGFSLNSGSSSDIQINGIQLVSGSSLTVEVSPDTPKEDIIVAGKSDVEISKFRFTSTGEAFQVTKLAINNLNALPETGAWDNNVISLKIEYTNSDGAIETKKGYLTSGKAKFSGLDFFIPKDDDSTVTVYATINSISGGATSGGFVKFVIDSDSDFEAVGQSSGEMFEPNNANSASLYISPESSQNTKKMHVHETKPILSLSSSSPSGSRTVSVNDELFKFVVSADSQEKVVISPFVDKIKIDFVSDGHINYSANGKTAYLKEGGTTVAQGTIAVYNSSSATVIFSPNGTNYPGIEILQGTSKTFSVVVDTVSLISGMAGTDSLLTVSIDLGSSANGFVNQGGFIWNDTNTQVKWVGNVSSSTLNGNTLRYSGTTPVNSYLSVSLSSDSPSGNISKDRNDVTLAKFKFEANNSDIIVEKISLLKSGSISIKDISNLELVNNENGVILSGPSDTVTFNDKFVVEKGRILTLILRGDIKSGANRGDTISFKITSIQAKEVTSNNTINVVGVPVAGNTLTITEPTLIISKSSSQTPSQILSKGAKGVAFMKFELSVTGGSGNIKVNEINISRKGISSDSDVDKLYLYDSANIRIGSEKTLYNGKVVFNNLNLIINEGTTRNIILKGDVSNNANIANNFYFSIDSSDNVKAEDINGNTVKITGNFPMNGNIMTIAGGVSHTCTDTDGGKDYYKKGYTVGYDPSASIGYENRNEWDICEKDHNRQNGFGGGDNSKKLFEFSCQNGNFHAEVSYECPNGCYDGACVAISNATTRVTYPNGGELFGNTYNDGFTAKANITKQENLEIKYVDFRVLKVSDFETVNSIKNSDKKSEDALYKSLRVYSSDAIYGKYFRTEGWNTGRYLMEVRVYGQNDQMIASDISDNIFEIKKIDASELPYIKDLRLVGNELQWTAPTNVSKYSITFYTGTTNDRNTQFNGCSYDSFNKYDCVGESVSITKYPGHAEKFKLYNTNNSYVVRYMDYKGNKSENSNVVSKLYPNFNDQDFISLADIPVAVTDLKIFKNSRNRIDFAWSNNEKEFISYSLGYYSTSNPLNLESTKYSPREFRYKYLEKGKKYKTDSFGDGFGVSSSYGTNPMLLFFKDSSGTVYRSNVVYKNEAFDSNYDEEYSKQTPELSYNFIKANSSPSYFEFTWSVPYGTEQYQLGFYTGDLSYNEVDEISKIGSYATKENISNKFSLPLDKTHTFWLRTKNYEGDVSRVKRIIYSPYNDETDSSNDFYVDDDNYVYSEPPAGYENDIVTAPSTSPFKDKDISSLEGQSAAYLYQIGIIGGFPDKTFRGDNGVNRAEASKFVLNVARIEVDKSKKNNGKFWDAKEGEWYIPYMVEASERNIIRGYGDGSFRPAQGVRRGEFLAILSRTFLLPEYIDHSYTDIPEEIKWVNAYAGIAKKYNLFPNEGNKLNPASFMKRDEIAVAIYQFLKNK